jgi:hypothetical protein
VKGLVLIAVLLGAVEVAAAQDAAVAPAKSTSKVSHASPLRLLPSRLPRPRRQSLSTVIPEQFAPPQEAYAAFPEPARTTATSVPSACQERLTKIAVFTPLPILAGPGECGATDAVLLDDVILPDQAKMTLTPPPTLRCSMAEAVANWLREDVAPAVVKLGAPLRGLDNFDSYDCRGRNRVRGATLSEHGRANALDIRGFKLANGEVIGLTDVNAAKDFRDAVRASACARFTTVLGPGADGNHEQHIHIDLAERHGGYKTCEWDVRELVKEAERTDPQPAQPAAALDEPVPLPRPRPPMHAANGTQSTAKKARSQLR